MMSSHLAQSSCIAEELGSQEKKWYQEKTPEENTCAVVVYSGLSMWWLSTGAGALETAAVLQNSRRPSWVATVHIASDKSFDANSFDNPVESIMLSMWECWVSSAEV